MVLDRLAVAPEVHALRPDFAVLALAVTGLVNGPGDAQSEAWLGEAEAAARGAGGVTPPHVVSWQEAYRAFGAKPQRTASSVEALWKRAAGPGLPRVNWLVDVYNAISVAHLLPVGGEDLASYSGPIRLVRATGAEAFDTMKDGQPVSDPPLPGEVVWADDLGVTCRRWNWRQCTRTRLTDTSTTALFLLERLAPLPLEALDAAGDALLARLRARTPDLQVERARFGPVAP
ncbi:MAG: cytoplasmic protein [Acidobacteria bacterium]|nr:cytoplasmic protein [Acidobacteriota bacterium]